MDSSQAPAARGGRPEPDRGDAGSSAALRGVRSHLGGVRPGAREGDSRGHRAAGAPRADRAGAAQYGHGRRLLGPSGGRRGPGRGDGGASGGSPDSRCPGLRGGDSPRRPCRVAGRRDRDPGRRAHSARHRLRLHPAGPPRRRGLRGSSPGPPFRRKARQEASRSLPAPGTISVERRNLHLDRPHDPGGARSLRPGSVAGPATSPAGARLRSAAPRCAAASRPC